MRRVMIALLAAGVLVVAGLAATSVTGGPAVAQEQDQARPVDGPPAPGVVLDEVLDSLVDETVITQAQADRIVDELTAKRAEIREQYPNLRWRGFRRGFRLGGLLADGVIDANELAELPPDHPLLDPDGPAASYLDDGQITQDELVQLRNDVHEQRTAGAPDA